METIIGFSHDIMDVYALISFPNARVEKIPFYEKGNLYFSDSTVQYQNQQLLVFEWIQFFFLNVCVVFASKVEIVMKFKLAKIQNQSFFKSYYKPVQLRMGRVCADHFHGFYPNYTELEFKDFGALVSQARVRFRKMAVTWINDSIKMTMLVL